ncbi:YobI family P-loop NTPase [Parvimonas micra]|jgi:hypothetical protein
MEKEKPKFNALTPEVLEEGNKSIYNEALDFAFDNKDIKNIAITGIYGSGKSTVWNTYVNKSDKLRNKNIITVSLGKYEDNIEEIKIKSEANEDKDNNSDTKDKDSEANNKGTEYDKIRENILDNENRVERQIINQILSQINPKDIPLSKYGFKSNKSRCTILFETLAMLGIVSSVLLWINRGSIVDKTGFSYICVLISCIIMLFLSILYIFYRYFRENILRISKIKFRGAEADLGYNEKNDETVLDRDIKELVYLIKSSKSKIIVFEDLDRYDNIAIYTKLRELNFLLNRYSKTNENKVINYIHRLKECISKPKNEEIKFVYMLRDGIFKSKNRTKFFDYIIPIVPVVDSKNSENKILEQLQHFKNSPDKKFVNKVSLYIDDMRLLKNIVNEYLIYENVVAMKELDLDSNKLFALIVLKNVFPNEFDLLQEDKGYILSIFSNVESFKNKAHNELEKSLEKVNDELIFLRNRQENSIFEAMATMVSPSVSLINNNSSSWVEFLKDKYLNEDETFTISYNNINYYNQEYKAFVEKYILTSQERKDIIEKLPIDKSRRIEELQKERILLEKKIREISICSFKDNLKQMTTAEVDDVFRQTSNKITQSHYFPLVRFLIIQGFIDETYGYYKGCFYSGSLQKNDTIFIKKLLESKEQDIFLDIESPSEIKDRLEESDFGRFNILNKKLLETCIESESKKAIFGIMDSVETNDNYMSLIQLLNTYNFNTIKKFVDIIIKNKTDQLLTLIDKINFEKSELFINILISVWTDKDINKQILKKFSPYLEDTEKIISLIDEKDFEVFIKNVSLAEVKFENMENSGANRDKIKAIEKNKAYKLTVSNVEYIFKNLLDKTPSYGYLLSEIFNCETLQVMKDYIEEQFEDFIKKYIDGNITNVPYENDEHIVCKIFNSNLVEKDKRKYIEINNIPIVKLSNIENLELYIGHRKLEDIDEYNIDLIDVLLKRDSIVFNSENINIFSDSIGIYGKEFLYYMDRNINENTYKDVVFNASEGLIRYILNSSNYISSKLFDYALIRVDVKISKLNSNLNKIRIQKMIEKSVILITEENFKTLLDDRYYDEVVKLINSQEENLEDNAIDILLKLEIPKELIYSLINSDISYENSIKLVRLILKHILIENIKFSKVEIIEYIIDYELSDDNKKYICKYFNKFDLKIKDKFINVLNYRDELSSLSNDNLNDDVMTFILNLNYLDVDIKIDLICEKIDNDTDVSLLKKYIKTVKEISKLAEVWNHKRPKLDNTYKEKIGTALIEANYVKKINYKDYLRISIIK